MHPLPIFQELTIFEAAARFDELGAELLLHLQAPWSRELHLDVHESFGYQSYRRTEADGGPDLRVVLHPHAADVVVANIAPVYSDDLTESEYNSALVEFAAEVLDAATTALGLRYEVTRPVIVMADLLGRALHAQLKDFSANADKDRSAYLRAEDLERWVAFLVSTGKADTVIPSPDLARWLEADGWSDDWARKLCDEYEFAHEVMRRYSNA